MIQYITKTLKMFVKIVTLLVKVVLDLTITNVYHVLETCIYQIMNVFHCAKMDSTLTIKLINVMTVT